MKDPFLELIQKIVYEVTGRKNLTTIRISCRIWD